MTITGTDFARNESATGPNPDRSLSYELQGSYWLAQRLSEQVQQMSALVATLHLK